MKQKYLPHPHSVKSFKQVQGLELVLLILQSKQMWGTIKFEVNFRPLIQLNSRGLLISFDGGQHSWQLSYKCLDQLWFSLMALGLHY